MQRKSGTDRQFHCLPAENGQGPGQAETHGAYGGIRRRAKLDRTTTEDLRLRAELHVHFEPNDRLVFCQDVLGDGGHFPIVALRFFGRATL